MHPFCFRGDSVRDAGTAAAVTGTLSGFWTKGVMAAPNVKLPAVDKRIGHLAPRRGADRLYRCASDPHLGGAFFLSVAEQVDQPQGFVFVQGQRNFPAPRRSRSGRIGRLWASGRYAGACMAAACAYPPLMLMPVSIRLLLTYVNNLTLN